VSFTGSLALINGSLICLASHLSFTDYSFLVSTRIRIEVCALVWAIWNCRNDIIFNNANCSPFLEVINRTLHWITTWALLLPEDQRGYMDSGCTRLMAVVQAIFSQGGWRHSNRIENV
jgi:hypothetical protein